MGVSVLEITTEMAKAGNPGHQLSKAGRGREAWERNEGGIPGRPEGYLKEVENLMGQRR